LELGRAGLAVFGRLTIKQTIGSQLGTKTITKPQ